MAILSIIIPVYKVEPYLPECLDSIAASPLDCWEAILIDDGSSDGCPAICDEYAAKDKRFQVIHQENAGVAAARNAGLDVAKGEWVWFVDSDDVVDMRPVGDMVEWLVNHNANLNANDEVDLVMFDLDSFNEYETLSLRNADATDCCRYENESQNGNEDEKVKVRVLALQATKGRARVNVSVNKNEFLSQHISFFHQQFWFRRSAQLRFTKGIRVSEDLELMYKYYTLCQQPVKFQAMLYYYRVRETSVTQDEDYRKKVVEDLPVVIHNLLSWINENSCEAEPWLDDRIMRLMQNLLYSASQVKSLDTRCFQIIVKKILYKSRELDFVYADKKKFRLAGWNVKMYFNLNRFYLQFKKLLKWAPSIYTS